MRIGCSGWQYKHWRGAFYPGDLPSSAGWNTTPRSSIPSRSTTPSIGCRNGTRSAPGRQRADRFPVRGQGEPISDTHEETQGPCRATRAAVLTRACAGPRLGPVLYQLPPRWHLDLERLDSFVRALPARRKHAIEFRDPSWYTADVFDLLAKHRVALCVHDMEGSATGPLAVGPFVYARFHGPMKYNGRYDDHTLDLWAEWMAEQRRQGTAIYAYFNNDIGAHAPRDAARLRARLLSSISASANSSTPASGSSRPAYAPRPSSRSRLPAAGGCR